MMCLENAALALIHEVDADKDVLTEPPRGAALREVRTRQNASGGDLLTRQKFGQNII